MIGVLVYGDNHFIVSGPEPDQATAHALLWKWTIIRIGAPERCEPLAWSIVSKAFREDLEWAIVIDATTEISPAVVQLLAELKARMVNVQFYRAQFS